MTIKGQNTQIDSISNVICETIIKGATAKYLRRHIDAVHESVPHVCQECDLCL